MRGTFRVEVADNNSATEKRPGFEPGWYATYWGAVPIGRPPRLTYEAAIQGIRTAKRAYPNSIYRIVRVRVNDDDSEDFGGEICRE